MKKPHFLCISLMLCYQCLIACSCEQLTYHFVSKIKQYEFVAMVEVIGKENKGVAYLGDYSFTRVRIIHQFSRKFIGKEVLIIDSKGFECFQSLPYKEVGEKFVIKGFYSDGEEHVELFLCDNASLKIENNMVTGWITRNKGRHWWGWTAILKKITFGLVERDVHKYKPRIQKMEIQAFLDLMREQLD